MLAFSQKFLFPIYFESTMLNIRELPKVDECIATLLTDLPNYMRCFLRITFLFIIIHVKAGMWVWHSVLFGTRKLATVLGILIISSRILH